MAGRLEDEVPEETPEEVTEPLPYGVGDVAQDVEDPA